MRSSGHRRTRLLAAGAVLTAVGGVIGFSQLSYAEDTPAAADGASGAGKVVGNNLTILTDTCVDSRLEKHDGFQKGNRCVSTEFGEVGAAANNPTLLITEAPRNVTAATPFTLRVSTRNLIRDRFLAAGQGGYYVESSVLQNGLVRGHFHTACRMLTSTDEAPDPAPVPAFFVATEDRRGSAEPDTVTIQVPGLPEEGTAQCSSWAGDGSHRIPMMERANQTPALDSVRINVRAAAGNGGDQGGNTGGGNNAGGGNTGGANPGGGNNNGGGNTGGGNTGGGNTGGGNNAGGGNTGNNTNSGAVKPTKPAPAASNPVIAKPNASKPAAVKPTTTRSATKPATTRTDAATSGDDEITSSGNDPADSGSDSDENSNGNESSNEGTSGGGNDSGATSQDTTEDEATPVTPTKKAKPQATATGDGEGTGLAGSDDGAPDDIQYEPATKPLAEPPAAEDSGPLSLISNNMVWVGGGAVVLLVGLLVAAFLRNRPRNTWR